jgi:DNA-binding LytR/AlgR family response regulator
MLDLVIIDDEPRAIALLAGYCNRIEDLNCIGKFRNPIEALDFIKANIPSFILLDINMPNLSGMDLAKLLPKECQIIFTTAHAQYAVESYNLATIDYLLKPISFDRFTTAVQKIRMAQDESYFLIKSGYDNHKILLDNLLFLKKDGNYMTYMTSHNKILSRQTVAEALEKLTDDFIQVHKSYIVPLSKITRFSTNSINIGDHEIPVGSTYKARIELFLAHKKRYPNRFLDTPQ